MNAVFLDTVGLLATWNETDPWHPAAAEAWDHIRRRRVRLFTTDFIFLELGNASSRYRFRTRVAAFRRDLQASGDLVVPTPEDCEEAWNAFDRGKAGQAGIVDEVSFVVMRRLGIAQAFTNDRHFKAAGFETLF